MAQRGNVDYGQIRQTARKGAGVQVQMFGGGVTTQGHVPVFNAAGDLVDGGAAAGGTGTVTSVGLTMPPEFIVGGTPVTDAGTFAVSKANQNAGVVWAGPPSGSPGPPTFRALVVADIPAGVGAVSMVFGRTGNIVAVSGDYNASQVTNAVSTQGSYADPPWITSLAWSKITGAPAGMNQTPWLQNINAAGFSLTNTGFVGIGTATPFNLLTVAGVSRPYSDAASGAGTFSLSSQTGGQTDDNLLMGVHTGDYSWIQAIKGGTATRNLLLNANGGNVLIGGSGQQGNYRLTVAGPAAGTGLAVLQLQTPGAAQGERCSVCFWPTFMGTADSLPRRAADIVAGFNAGSWGAEFLSFNVGYLGPSSPGSNDPQYLTTERMRVTASGVGIGTTAPLCPLDAGQALAPVKIASYTNTIASCYGMGVLNGQLTFGANINATSGTPQMVLQNNAYLGIGTTAPAAQLTLSGAGQATASFNTTGALGGCVMCDDSGTAAGNGGAILFSGSSQAWKFAAIKGYVTNGGGNSQGDIVFCTRRNSGDATLTEAMRINSTGTFSVSGPVTGTSFESSGAFGFAANLFYSGGWFYRTSGPGVVMLADPAAPGQAAIWAASAGTAGAGASLTEMLLFKPSVPLTVANVPMAIYTPSGATVAQDSAMPNSSVLFLQIGTSQLGFRVKGSDGVIRTATIGIA
jgi:hypothetical protein